MKTKMSWDEYFAQMVLLTASKSEDESTKCGAVIVTPNHEVVSTGYNGMPRGIADTPERQERPLKYKYFEHAERNAVYNCARSTASTLHNIMWVTGMPCSDCARAIIQAGIQEVVVLDGDNQSKEFKERWKESFDFTEALLEEAKIRLRTYKI